MTDPCFLRDLEMDKYILFTVVCLIAAILPVNLPAQTAPGMTSIDTIDELVDLAYIKSGSSFTVKGYHKACDDGGGIFAYESQSSLEPDDGTVIKLKKLPGRVVRVFDPKTDVYAEWFGAHGDGIHDDKDAINACLDKFKRVKLLAKTYAVGATPSHYDPKRTLYSIGLKSDYTIQGTDRNKTIIRLIDGTNPNSNVKGLSYFDVIFNKHYYESAVNVVITDLTIDCNFNNQDKRTTIAAIHIRGGSARIERVNFRGFGTGYDPLSNLSPECFVLAQRLVYKDKLCTRQAATMRNLDFTDAGSNHSVDHSVSEITLIAIGGQHNFSNSQYALPSGPDPDYDPSNNGENANNWWPCFGGIVENIYAHDMLNDPKANKSPFHGITYGDCIGMTVRNNRFRNYDGCCVYVMSWPNRDMVITGNEFIDVYAGLVLQLKGRTGAPIQLPKHENVLFENNTVKIGKPMHMKYTPVGIQLYGQNIDDAIRMKNIIIRNNYLEGHHYVNAKGKDIYPKGFTMEVLKPNYENIIVENNVIEFPDYSADKNISQQPYSMSLEFFSLERWKQDKRSGNVIFRNNKNKAGMLLKPMISNFTFDNEPLFWE